MRQIGSIGLLAILMAWVGGCGGTAASSQGGAGSVAVRTTPANAIAASGEPNIEIHLNRTTMAGRGVQRAMVTQALSHFFSDFPVYSLTDLLDLKISTADGTLVPLREVATVDVWFGAAKTQIAVSGKE